MFRSNAIIAAGKTKEIAVVKVPVDPVRCAAGVVRDILGAAIHDAMASRARVCRGVHGLGARQRPGSQDGSDKVAVLAQGQA
jgi:hypothetical protein